MEKKSKAQLNDKAISSTSAQKQNKKLTVANRLTHQFFFNFFLQTHHITENA
jgi:hypothetical protein